MALNTRTLSFSFLSVLVVFASRQAFSAIPFLDGRTKIDPLAAPAVSPSPKLGGWTKIDNLNAPAVVEVGRFAINQHNKVTKAGLIFVRVVGGETQVVSGTNYRLLIEANKGSVVTNYKALVYLRLDNTKHLLSFKQA